MQRLPCNSGTITLPLHCGYRTLVLYAIRPGSPEAMRSLATRMQRPVTRPLPCALHVGNALSIGGELGFQRF
jgi:hypothetical protein